MYKVWKDLIKPRRVEVDKETYSNTYGKFKIEPLEKGFGTTIGNSLRRIMLSSLYGAAITIVNIDGVNHEFSSIVGVKEDVLDIILNLKGVRFKVAPEFREEWAVISVKGPGYVTAKDIKFSENEVEILNPDHLIATLDNNAVFNAKVLVKLGRGWSPAERNRIEDMPIGYIPVDAIFSPIKRATFEVTNTRVGQMTDYDRLTFEVWTDGSMDPEDALGISAKILKEHLDIFIHFDEETEEEIEYQTREFESTREAQINENIFKSVDELELPVRASNCLKNANIKWIGELVQKTEAEMLTYKNFGKKSLNDIKSVLAELGLSLNMKIPDWEEQLAKHLSQEKKTEE
ncbi:MAG: DNA-directed RNA polymerase subunit alpha [Proteobacteria bacterium]|nr:DNA-directed RNA polymerase subunit alpha [Pseudomonadota bacterium]